MIKVYENGKEFIEENSSFLDENKYMSALFYVDAKVLESPDSGNYAIKVMADGKKLLGIKVQPYNLLLYGDKEVLEQMLVFLHKNGYLIDGIMCPSEIGDSLIEVAKKAINKDYIKTIGMDFMETNEISEPSSDEVIRANEDDFEEIYLLCFDFFRDCGLSDKPSKEQMEKKMDGFRLIKENGKIVCMACYTEHEESSARIGYVYTRPEYRGKGYARKLVNTIKNEILEKGKIATLNVDQKNPISNHLYDSLGFKKVFLQAIYTLAKEVENGNN